MLLLMDLAALATWPSIALALTVTAGDEVSKAAKLSRLGRLSYVRNGVDYGLCCVIGCPCERVWLKAGRATKSARDHSDVLMKVLRQLRASK